MILINLANIIMMNSHFEVNEATRIDTNEKFDYVISHSVFHYFKDLDYAKTVIENMLNKANKKIGVFDINDQAKEEKYHKIRMESMPKKEYQKKYADLKHMFYDKDWFLVLGKEFGLKVDIYDQSYEKYGNSSLRFNVIMEKI